MSFDIEISGFRLLPGSPTRQALGRSEQNKQDNFRWAVGHPRAPFQGLSEKGMDGGGDNISR